jgi:hypothetical protein
VSKNIWDILNRLEIATIVVVGGRPGSDFLHTLFDSHPEILTFDGTLFFSQFYDSAKSLWKGWGPNEDIATTRVINTNDYFSEFAWNNLHKFKTRYDIREDKDKLGPEKDQSNVVDIDLFVKYGVDLMISKEFNRKNVFLATYGAFALARGEDLKKKKVLLHSVKHDFRIRILTEEFSHVKVFAATRDPRAGYTISMEDWVNYAPDRLTPSTHYFYINRIIKSTSCMDVFRNVEIRVNILERLHQHPEEVLENMCKWLGIQFDDILLRSTCGGKDWWGDALTTGIKSPFNKERYSESQLLWKRHLSLFDNILFSSLMRKEISHYNWVSKYTSIGWLLLTPILILLPNKWDVIILVSAIKKKQIRIILEWFYYLLKRYQVMFSKFLSVIFKKDMPVDYF